jgi:hypothetical protein
MGRPKKRLCISREDSTTQTASDPEALPADEYNSADTLNVPALDAPELEAISWLSPSAWPDFEWEEFAPKEHAEPLLIDQDALELGDFMAKSVPAENGTDHDVRELPTPASMTDPTGCSCLSILYLALHSLQTASCDPHQVNFPHTLQPLREAMQTAARVLPCQICPKRFLSAIQNVHLMGTLLVCIAERFGKILSQLSEDAKRASSAGETRVVRLLDVSGSDAKLCDFSTALQVELTPDEWCTLRKKVVRAEVAGSSRDGTSDDHVSLSSLCRTMRRRQERWHQMECPDDFPRSMRPAQAETPGNSATEYAAKDTGREKHEHFCTKMVSVAEKLMQSFDWS